MGPKAMVSGGLAGGALGTIAGLLTLAILKFSGTTAEEIRFWRKGYKEYENRYPFHIWIQIYSSIFFL